MSDPERQVRKIAEECSSNFNSYALIVRSTDEHNRDYIMSTWGGQWSDIQGLVSILRIRAEESERIRFFTEMEETALESEDDL